jgi:predicted adenylyl cyclase CyaB
MENIEIKARLINPDQTRDSVKKLDHTYVGLDHQIDTYFKTTNGRFKLRESSLSEPYLIFYLRENLSGPKSSVYQKLPVEDAGGLKELLIKMQGLHTIIEKKREIYLYENVRIHLDDVVNLGSFLEFEAVMDEKFNNRELEFQKVEYLMEILGIANEDLISESYENLIDKKHD